MRRELADVLETVKRAKARNKGCTLLIGAGCSVKGGIPTANGFLEIIRKEYPRAYERAPKKTYPHVMAELLMAERHDLISQYINSAKLNWAYLAIAQLLKHGYVDRVLTVNFDPLVMRACALVGIFPAVYDFAASQNFDPDFIAQQSVFYLHGQHTGFVVLNTESEVERLSQHLGPVFTDSARGRVWIVAGYSGENDPVFDHLVKMGRFDNGLYWICYKESPPQTHVQERLLVSGKDCFCVQGHDADDFFVLLAQGLGCFPPTFVQTPFTHLENLLEPVLPYSQPGNDSSLEAIPRKLLQDAIEKIEKPGFLALRAREQLLAGNFNAVIEMEPELAKTPTAELADAVAWGYILAGDEFASEADQKKGEEADRLWKLASEKYEAALKIDPGKFEALNNWGNTLLSQAKTRNGEEADRLWALAYEKYAAALKITEFDIAMYNWANALATQARTKNGREADRLRTRAVEKFDEVLRINPDNEVALYDCGYVLIEQAQTKTGDEADRLYTQAGEKLKAVVRINPDHDDALNSWAAALLSHGLLGTEEEAKRRWELAAENCKAALKIKPDKHAALYNWSLALSALAQIESQKEAKRLLELADQKLSAARALAPEEYPLDDETPEVESKKESSVRRKKKSVRRS